MAVPPATLPSPAEFITPEDQTWRAMQRSGADLLPFLSEDCIMQFPLGLKVSRTSEPSLKDIMLSDAFIPWTSYKMKEVTVLPLGSEAALISYQVKAYRPPIEDDVEEVKVEALISSVWRRDAMTGQFLMCFHQQTPF